MQLHGTGRTHNTDLSTRAWFLSRAIPVGVLVCLGTLATLSTVTAAGDEGPRACSVRTLRGDYGILVSGHRPTPPAGKVESFVGTAIRTYDGKGGFTQFDSGFVPTAFVIVNHGDEVKDSAPGSTTASLWRVGR